VAQSRSLSQLALKLNRTESKYGSSPVLLIVIV